MTDARPFPAPSPPTLLLGFALALPAAGLLLLLAQPELDHEWQHQPSHFWLVLVAALAQIAARVEQRCAEEKQE